jgi:DNA-binding NarL/FixJ family response regulator
MYDISPGLEAPMTISVVMAEDDPLLRTLLAERLTTESDLKLVSQVGTGREALEAAAGLGGGVLLLDLNLPGLSGWQVLEGLSGMDAPPRVLMLSGAEDEETQVEAARRGAHGFLSKSQAFPELPDAIRAVAAGRVWFGPRIVGQVFREYPALVSRARQQTGPLRRLTEKEREVLVEMARGLTNPQIAERLYMSVSTVKTHVSSIFRKLELPNRTEAAVLAVREGLLQPSDIAEAL